ncbi:MAG: DUF3343 domain-containing protein [Eubacteriales bacterium]|nr:DUF3343 domain-containing protein [Eubacteriales bacterium]MDD4389387.1 DUF3343 domain-containing protein [Eubacteriales bacterium]
MEYVITFKNTNFAIKAEQILLADRLRVTVMPLPSQIKAGCGICLRINPEQIGSALKILKSNHIGETVIYLKRVDNNRTSFQEIVDSAILM